MAFEVYVHVPFCLQRCGYCDFNTYTAVDMGEGASRKQYARMAIQEMQLVKRWQEYHQIDEPPASSVFFGGGTPTVLPARDLVMMLQAIRQIWGIEPGAEITTEANPDTADENYIATLAQGGFTRISFGMQSAVPHVLSTLDRTHTPQNVTRGVQAAEKSGLRSSVDLIYGTPGESLDDWRTSVSMALALGVNHVSAYALSVEARTKMGRQIAAGRIPPPDDDDEAQKYEIADEMLSSEGLQWYEISNWARAGYESQHNLGYWHNIDWAGIGPGAHSHYANAHRILLRDHDDVSDHSAADYVNNNMKIDVVSRKQQDVLQTNIRAWGILHPKRWAHAIHAGNVPWQDYECISDEDDLIETVMLGMRLREGLDLATLKLRLAKHHAVSHMMLDQVVSELCSERLTIVDNTRLIATRQGRLLNDLVIEKIVEACERDANRANGACPSRLVSSHK